MKKPQKPSVRELVRNHDGFFSNFFHRATAAMVGMPAPPEYHWRISDADMELAAEIRKDRL